MTAEVIVRLISAGMVLWHDRMVRKGAIATSVPPPTPEELLSLATEIDALPNLADKKIPAEQPEDAVTVGDAATVDTERTGGDPSA